jgi:Na+-transporting NADH:ubiquinone oxidoreductase subunit A
MIKLKKGLDLPIEGTPEQKVYDGPRVTKVALIGDDIVGMKPTMTVKVGEKVKTGQLLFTDKKTEGVRYTSPASGEVVEVNRGARRAFQSVVIKVEGDEHETFESHKGAELSAYSGDDVKKLLLESGTWVSLRQRPYSKVANPADKPASIFVTAIDTHPLAANPEHFIKAHEAAFEKGLKAISKLADKVFLCTAPGSKVPGNGIDGVKREEFGGPHPAGLVGTHIHFLDPVSEKKTVWHIGYADVVAIGKLIETGQLFTERYVALGGPQAKSPRIVKTRLGACLADLVSEEKKDGVETRAVSGSIFGGRDAAGPFGYLGRFHNAVALLKEGREREFMGWHSPGFDKFSVKPIYVARFLGKKFGFNTNTNGSHRSIVPIGSYEKVMPLDILPTFLTRYLLSNNTEMCVKLGALELDEEDLALITFVDPCKNDFGPKLREKLTIIEKEG